MTGDVTVRADLVYDSVKGGDSAKGRELHLDLYLPASRPAPVCLWLHGGGWVRGSRTARAEERLVPVARAGVAVAAVQYRLSGEAAFPAQLDDARSAVRWLRRNGGGLGLRTDRIGVWGGSSGGHLAALLALCPDERDGELGDSSVQAAVCWFPITDLTLRDTDVPEGPPPPFLSGPPPSPSNEARLLGVGSVADANHEDPALDAPPVLAAVSAFLRSHLG